MRDDRPIPEPSQLWVIEQLPATELSAPDRDAVAHANVVIYDRALERVVADALPAGGYAEPLSFPCQEAGRALSPRALQFAVDGWSVVQLVEKSPCWRERLSHAPQELAAVRNAAVRLIAKDDDGRYIFGPIVPKPASPSYPFTANGLAG
jgi:hypothetical protein